MYDLPFRKTSEESELPLVEKSEKGYMFPKGCKAHLAVLLVVAVSHMFVIYMLGHQVYLAMERVETVDDHHVVRLPKTIEDIKRMQFAVVHVAEQHSVLVLAWYSILYLFKQTYAVPGSAILNVCAGIIWGVKYGVLLVSVLTGIGATSCFLLSWFLAGEYLGHAGPKSRYAVFRRLYDIRTKCGRITKDEGDLTIFMYLTSLRLFPMTPNWLLNIVMPHCGIPVKIFFSSVFVGLLPYNFVTVSAGTVISSISSTSDIFDIGTLMRFALVALLFGSFMPAMKYAKRHFHFAEEVKGDE